MTATFRAANLLLALCVAATLILEIVLLATNRIDTLFAPPTTYVPFSTRLVNMFSFLTTLSNLLAGIVALLLAIRPERRGRMWRVIRMDALLSIAAIGIAFQVLFAPHLELDGAPLLLTVLFHVVNPLLAVLIWLVLDTRRQWAFRDVLWALIWPAVYLMYVFVRGALVHWYPYALADVDALGAGRAYLNGLGVLVLFFALAVVAWIVDGRVPSLRTNERTVRGREVCGQGPNRVVLPRK
ncbi:Pr6Pr family membrane protein [Streptomyces sp. GMR22]|uniref:Pr6Pr family membrane protein n=1 Tax=Streptomyces sp. GMR22 TaxID=2759524 RepID=UPI0015F94845|nr:Pr6Pr family membrane protein [Streptomyces sp. GMR22]MBA6438854.1 Pr6Pr family membrane protein [Streptomyces sp. GMR22]